MKYDKKILIIDDEKELLNYFSSFLKNTVSNIDTSDQAKEGVDKIWANNYDLVICDINMPEMSGIDIIKTVRSKNNEVPFIFFTAYGDKELKLESLKYGAYGFVDKPDFDKLLSLIDQLFLESGDLDSMYEGFFSKSFKGTK